MSNTAGLLKKRKILFIAHDSLKDGSGRCLFELVSLLIKKSDIKPIVLTHWKNDINDALDNLGVENYFSRYGYTCSWTRNTFSNLFKRLLYRRFFNWYSLKKLKKKIDFNTIDLIHSNSSVIDFGAYLHKKFGIPHVWHIREFGKIDFNLHYLVDDFPKYLNEYATKMICVSNAVRDYYIKQGVDEKKIKTIYDGVLEQEYQSLIPLTHEKKVIRICMCGRLQEAKGQYLAIKALNKLKENELQMLHLDFYGGGRDLPRLQELVKKFKLDNYVTFKGFSNNLKDEIKKYDIGLNLSRAEGFGRTTVEYMLSGLYVIGHNTGATPELLANGKYGSLISVGNIGQLANEISKYIRNSSDCKKIQEDARNFALYHFTLEKNIENFVEEFISIIRDN